MAFAFSPHWRKRVGFHGLTCKTYPFVDEKVDIWKPKLQDALSLNSSVKVRKGSVGYALVWARRGGGGKAVFRR